MVKSRMRSKRYRDQAETTIQWGLHFFIVIFEKGALLQSVTYWPVYHCTPLPFPRPCLLFICTTAVSPSLFALHLPLPFVAGDREVRSTPVPVECFPARNLFVWGAADTDVLHLIPCIVPSLGGVPTSLHAWYPEHIRRVSVPHLCKKSPNHCVMPVLLYCRVVHTIPRRAWWLTLRTHCLVGCSFAPATLLISLV